MGRRKSSEPQALAPLDLTHVQFVLLACTWWLNEQGERPSQIALAAQAGTDIKMTSQVLRSLERDLPLIATGCNHGAP
jgi:DNA-binding MarR family transcriptional regulator